MLFLSYILCSFLHTGQNVLSKNAFKLFWERPGQASKISATACFRREHNPLTYHIRYSLQTKKNGQRTPRLPIFSLFETTSAPGSRRWLRHYISHIGSTSGTSNACDIFHINLRVPCLALIGDIGYVKDEGFFSFLCIELIALHIVFLVPGNHELYHSSWSEAKPRFKGFEAELSNTSKQDITPAHSSPSIR